MAHAQLALWLGNNGFTYTVSGSVYTITNTNLDGNQMRRLARAAAANKCEVLKASTALTVHPRA